MTPETQEAVILTTLVLVRDHCDVLTTEAQRLAQAHALEKVMAAIGEATDETGRTTLRGESAVRIFSLLVDSVARLKRATEDRPSLVRARARLGDWQDTLIQIRDQAITRAIRKGPAHRPERHRNGWNRPDPRA